MEINSQNIATTATDIPQMRTLPQLAREFEGAGLTYNHIYRWIKEGRIPYLTRGRRYIINRDRFVDFLNTADDRERETV